MQSKQSKIREDLLTASGLRRLARTEKKTRTARRMLAIANALDGMTFAAAARVVGMERQALGDAVRRYNAEGVDGLYDRAKPGRPRKLDARQEAESWRRSSFKALIQRSMAYPPTRSKTLLALRMSAGT